MRNGLMTIGAACVMLLGACTAEATPTPVPTPAATATLAPTAIPTYTPTATPGSGMRQVPLGQPFTLRAYEPVELATAYVVLSFEVVEDSRCPKDVTCVWAGQARVKLNTSIAGSASETASIILGPDGKGTGNLAHRTISVSDLQPYPVSTVRIEPSAYALTVLVE